METLRPASQHEASAIRALIHQVKINPIGLDWRRFQVIVDKDDRLLACGQLKRHSDGTRELASLAVQLDCRNQGLARQVIQYFLSNSLPPLFLTCAAHLQPFYEKFGFRVLSNTELPPYFRRLTTVVSFFQHVFRLQEQMLVMIWEGNGSTA